MTTIFNVHIYREMRLVFSGIEADTHESAAAIARDKPTEDADSIDDCEGESLAALVDVQGDEEYAQSRTIDFEGERERRAATALLTSLEAVLPYAENEARSLDAIKDCSVAEEEADKAWKAINKADVAIDQAKAAGLKPDPAEVDVRAILVARRQIAAVWSIDDVQSVRPGLTGEQAWEVLQDAERRHDACIGITWEVLRCHADSLFGDGLPAADID
jgi:hypothetical protein